MQNITNDEFYEITTRTIDNKYRVTLGKLMEGYKRVKIYKNNKGEILLRPLLEIPASEAWLFQDKEALRSVRQGLEDVAEGNVTKLNTEEL